MTFTKEQLQHIIETDHVQCGDASALARMALAGMEAEPVARVISEPDKNLSGEYAITTIGRIEKMPYGTKLYTTPKPITTSERAELENYRGAQQVVPSDGRDQFEEWFKFHHGEEHSIVTLHRANGGLNYRDPHVDLAWIAWKDSRAAMQSGAVKDGWVMVPREATSEMINSAMRDNETGEVAEIYELMIAAAPKQEAE